MKPMSEAEKSLSNKDENETSDSVNRVYELGYLLVPTIAEEDVPVTYGNIKDLISSHSGMTISDEMPRTRELAYSMSKVVANVRSKWNTAYFGWIKFSMDAGNITELKKKLDLDPNIIRFLIIKTVKENTIASKRFGRSDVQRKPRAPRNEGGEPTAPINKEEIDKEIEALVA
ncbi:MAG: 30S ribosomal protein S6 [Minisyncoccia bacterium]